LRLPVGSGFAGVPASAALMKSCQILAGIEPPTTCVNPSIVPSGISARG
jgi:hypothetical protein